MTIHSLPSTSATHQLSLGLRWLNADEETATSCQGVAGWQDFLSAAELLPAPQRLTIARLWPLLGAVNGVLAMSGLLVWPEGSGVHLLLFLIAFWATPLLLVTWSALSGLVRGRTPWWQSLITPHRDRVIALWFTRQSLLAHGVFCLTGIVWLWLMLLTRQMIFYWSTSIAAVSDTVESLFRALSLGVITPPDSHTIVAAEAGLITGWQSALLADTWLWALWLTQVTALWLLLPIGILLAICQWKLAHILPRWPNWNHRLRLRYEQCRQPVVHYRALQPPQPATLQPSGRFPTVNRLPPEPGFAWQLEHSDLPAGTMRLGSGSYAQDRQAVTEQGQHRDNWYIAVNAVPTGELADLLLMHRSRSRPMRLFLVCESQVPPDRTDTWQQGWRAFLTASGVEDTPVYLVTTGDGPRGQVAEEGDSAS